MKCPKCNARNKSLARFCIECGQGLQVTQKASLSAQTCSKCGKSYPEGTKFCTVDGTPLQHATQPGETLTAVNTKRTVSDATTSPESLDTATVSSGMLPPKPKKGKVIALVAIAIAVLGASAFFLKSNGNSSEKVDNVLVSKIDSAPVSKTVAPVETASKSSLRTEEVKPRPDNKSNTSPKGTVTEKADNAPVSKNVAPVETASKSSLGTQEVKPRPDNKSNTSLKSTATEFKETADKKQKDPNSASPGGAAKQTFSDSTDIVVRELSDDDEGSKAAKASTSPSGTSPSDDSSSGAGPSGGKLEIWHSTLFAWKKDKDKSQKKNFLKLHKELVANPDPSMIKSVEPLLREDNGHIQLYALKLLRACGYSNMDELKWVSENTSSFRVKYTAKKMMK